MYQDNDPARDIRKLTSSARAVAAHLFLDFAKQKAAIAIYGPPKRLNLETGKLEQVDEAVDRVAAPSYDAIARECIEAGLAFENAADRLLEPGDDAS